MPSASNIALFLDWLGLNRRLSDRARSKSRLSPSDCIHPFEYRSTAAALASPSARRAPLKVPSRRKLSAVQFHSRSSPHRTIPPYTARPAQVHPPYPKPYLSLSYRAHSAMPVPHQVKEEPSYRRAIFVAVSLLTAGICSIYPVMCFKNHSSREKAKMNEEMQNIEQHLRKEEEWIRDHVPRVRERSRSRRRISHVPEHRRRHSSVRPSRHFDDRRPSHRSHHHYPNDLELQRIPQSPHSDTSRHAYDRDLDRERRRRHHGHPPPRRYHHSS